MFFESLAITGIIIAIAIMYMRTQRKSYALATLPLALLPATNALLAWTSKYIEKVLPFDRITIWMTINVTAAIVSCLLIGIFAQKLKRKYTKLTYMAMSVIFNVVLLMILLANAMENVS